MRVRVRADCEPEDDPRARRRGHAKAAALASVCVCVCQLGKRDGRGSGDLGVRVGARASLPEGLAQPDRARTRRHLLTCINAAGAVAVPIEPQREPTMSSPAWASSRASTSKAGSDLRSGTPPPGPHAWAARGLDVVLTQHRWEQL